MIAMLKQDSNKINNLAKILKLGSQAYPYLPPAKIKGLERYSVINAT